MLITENIEQRVGEWCVLRVDAVQQLDFAAPALFPVRNANPVLELPMFAVAPDGSCDLEDLVRPQLPTRIGAADLLGDRARRHRQLHFGGDRPDQRDKSIIQPQFA